MSQSDPVVIAAYARTPMGGFQGVLSPVKATELGSVAVRAAVEHGAGAAALSRLAVADALASGALVALNLPLPKRQFYSLRHRERWMSQAERELLAMAAAGASAALRRIRPA